MLRRGWASSKDRSGPGQSTEHNRERERQTKPKQWSLKDAVFAVIPEAMAHASGGGLYPVSTRFLFYPVRKFIQRYTDKELDYDYFSQDLLIQYQRLYGPLAGLYYDPRGVLYEPHTDRDIQLGTREVDEYRFPAWLYDKILYVEKKGLWPLLKAAGIAERYDMAVVAAEGYANEAVRTLFAHADKQRNYRLFVLHDADPHGYNIARTLREETRRMPDHRIEVIDFGLRLEEALGMGLQMEDFTRKKAIPQSLRLTEVERRHFVGRQVSEKSWLCQRVELNALTAPQLVALIERKLAEHGATAKVVPPADVLRGEAIVQARSTLRGRIEAELATLLDVEALVGEVLEATVARHLDTLTPEEVRSTLERVPQRRWTGIVAGVVQRHLDGTRSQWREALIEKMRGVSS